MPGCVDPEADYPPNWDLDSVQLFVGPDDTLHFVGRTYQGVAIYRQGKPNEPWGTPEVLDSDKNWGDVIGAVAPDGALHLVWAAQGGDLYYCKRAANGVWSSSQLVGRGATPKIALDRSGVLHILYAGDNPYPSEQQSLYYRQRKTDGSWSEATELARYLYNYTSLTWLAYDIVAANGEVHIAWGKPLGAEWAQAFQLVTRRRDGNGAWMAEQGLQMSVSNFDAIHLLATADNVIHLFWQQDATGFYAYQPPSQAWSEPEMVGMFNHVAADRADTLYLGLTPRDANDGYYRYKRPTTVWSDRIAYDWPTVYGVYLMDIDAGSAGHLHTIWDLPAGPIYHAVKPVTHTTESTLFQTVAIPATLEQPTLSFAYQLTGGEDRTAGLAVTVTDAMTTTTVFTATAAAPWTFGWAGLDAWQGETVTVTFALHQAPDELPVQVYLDDISLTSWQTPVPRQIAPQQLEPGLASTVVISGENFLQTAQVYLGDMALTDVAYIDAHRLQIVIAADVKPGRYPIWVKNGFTVPRVYAGQLQVGSPLYLPIVAR
jgi:hypothetical protein